MDGAYRVGLARVGAIYLMASAGAAWAGPAIGQFEIKSLGAEPGEIELQSQNAYAVGSPRRRVLAGPDGLEGDDNSLPRQSHALEIEYGFSHHLKARVGVEFETERREELKYAGDGEAFEALALDEIEGEVIVVLKRRHGDGLGFGWLVEYEHPVEPGSARTLYSGPIVELARGPWLLSFNPMLVQFFGGERGAHGRTDEKRDFAYAASIRHEVSDRLSLALEAYGTVERVGGSGDRSDNARLFGEFDQHRIGPVAYWTFPHQVSGAGGEAETILGLGALLGLNDATPDATLKLSVELVF